MNMAWRSFASRVIRASPPLHSTRFLRFAVVSTTAAAYIANDANLRYTECEAVESKKALPVIYQYQICPFCQRVKAYLDFLGVDYEVVEVDPLTKSELAFSKDYKKVPLAVIGDETLKESDIIVKYITDNYSKSKAVPDGFFPEDTEHWMQWSEKRLAVMLYPNITRSFAESWECFSYADNVTTWNPFQRMLVRTSGPAFMFFANGKIKEKYNIVDERQELKDVLKEWTTALDGKKFLHGDYVSLPDLMVYGVLRAIRNFQTFREIMAENDALKTWFNNVDAVTTSHEVCKV